jgi:hypothetical protein
MPKIVKKLEIKEKIAVKPAKSKSLPFVLSDELVNYVHTFPNRSAFMRDLINAHLNGQVMKPETAEMLKNYQNLFGEEPEAVIRKVLQKRMAKIESNLVTLKNKLPAEVKNKVGGAFLKLNRAYDALVEENAQRENKMAITFNLLFSKTACNHQAIRRWLKANREGLEAYHLSVGITDPAVHNRQMGVLKRIQKHKEQKSPVIGEETVGGEPNGAR